MACIVAHVYHHDCYLKSTVCRFHIRSFIVTTHRCGTSSTGTAFALHCCVYVWVHFYLVQLTYHFTRCRLSINIFFITNFRLHDLVVALAPTASYSLAHTRTHFTNSTSARTHGVVCKKGWIRTTNQCRTYARTFQTLVSVRSLSSSLNRMFVPRTKCVSYFWPPLPPFPLILVRGFFRFRHSLTSDGKRLNFIQHKSLLSSNYSSFCILSTTMRLPAHLVDAKICKETTTEFTVQSSATNRKKGDKTRTNTHHTHSMRLNRFSYNSRIAVQSRVRAFMRDALLLNVEINLTQNWWHWRSPVCGLRAYFSGQQFHHVNCSGKILRVAWKPAKIVRPNPLFRTHTHNINAVLHTMGSSTVGQAHRRHRNNGINCWIGKYANEKNFGPNASVSSVECFSIKIRLF